MSPSQHSQKWTTLTPVPNTNYLRKYEDLTGSRNEIPNRATPVRFRANCPQKRTEKIIKDIFVEEMKKGTFDEILRIISEK